MDHISSSTKQNKHKESLLPKENQKHIELRKAYKKIHLRRLSMLLVLFILIIASLFTDFILGPSGLTLSELWNILFYPEQVKDAYRVIVWEVRLPYALMAIAVGLALGLAGAEMQTILNNPLASPFTLGVSSAAALGAALAIVLDVGIPGVPVQWVVSANAFIFAILAAFILDSVTRWSRVGQGGVVLFGIALVFSFNALVSLLQFIATEDTLQGIVLWTMGSLARANWLTLMVMSIAFVVILIWSLSNAWRLTALRLGEDRAISFGINTKKLRLNSLFRISLLSALAVAFVGPIGFIGLVSPHIARLIFGEDHRYYLPGAALVGAFVLSLSSIASKNLLHGIIIPVGIVTALVGVPFFLTIVLRNRGRI